LIVLDILANQDGDELTNNATWTWTGGTRTTSAPLVQIIEPELTIDKNGTPIPAAIGDIITFTLDIAHSSQSSADAFDVVVSDQIPAGLALVTGSVNVTGTAAVTSTNYDTVTNMLTVRWDAFRLGETARVTFQATFVGPAPVVNSASAEWTSLLIDPDVDNTPPTPDVPEQLSDYNTDATERGYDPTAPTGANNYDITDSVTLTSLVSETAEKLPSTGFAPNIITELLSMPEGFSYAQTDLWIEIPKLGLKMDIVGVPFDTDTSEWNLTWLADNAGWLENTAYPTHAGNSAITAHTTLANGLPGPFSKLDTLSYGDQVIVHLGGQKYIYEVRGNKSVRPNAVNSVLKHEEYPWLTLITCKSYSEKTGEYLYRTVMRAVLTKIVDE
jgi:LPXTG-site transpeptidase (sortase) family protein